ncbi:MAG: 6-hydroxymethylpterin diphosphokinase MptE-like protein [Candidatus Marinarcus sp.]|uniref:motility associated factor glycosyltransferase family protein n=1 Tax=Candidatus Marinarcus sp. TaxID=3100987 RepID=UPI003B00489E
MSKEKAQQELQNILLKTYFRNLEFLQEEDNLLYERVVNLSHAIDTQTYSPRYEIDFLEQEGEFDIYDVHTDTYLYHKKPKAYKNKALNSVGFDMKGSFSLFERELYKISDIETLEFDKSTITENNESFIKVYCDLQKYVQILKEDVNKPKKLKEISKFIFIGTLLGRHIPLIAKKIKAKTYFVHEPNLEIFRLSLFVVDYTILIDNASVRFSIMDDAAIFEKKIMNYLYLNNWENHIIKFYTTDYNIQESFEQVLNGIAIAKPTAFNYNMILYNVIRNLILRVNHYKFIKFPLNKMLPLFSSKPILYLCAGPSLEENIQWVKQHQKKFILVTIGATYKKLLNQEIVPDIIVTLDGSYKALNKLQFDLESTQKIQDVIILASAMTEQKILDRFNQEKLFLYETMISLNDDTPLSGHSVGEFGYKLLLEFGAKELYLLGTDLALHQKEGSSHSSDSSSHAKKFDLNNIKSSAEKGTFSLSDDLVRVKGNFEDKVLTTRLLNNSLVYYNNIEKENFQHIYNLCTHGAFIKGTQPTLIENIKIDEFKELEKNQLFQNMILNELNETSSIGLDKEQVARIKRYNEKLDEILFLIQEFRKIKFYTYDNFKLYFREIIKLFIEKSEDRPSTLSKVISLFIPIVNIYIDYSFNTAKMKNESSKIDKVAAFWFDDVETFILDYKKLIEENILNQ